MTRVHKQLADNYAWYKTWHEHPHRSAHHWAVLVAISAVTSGTLFSWYNTAVASPFDTTPTSITSTINAIPTTQVATNEVLVKLKDEAQVQLAEGLSPEETLPALHDLPVGKKATEVAKLTPEGSTDNSAVNDWYAVSLEGTAGKTSLKHNPKTGDFTASTQSGKDLTEVIDQLKTDPNVEAVEPNYIIRASRVPNDPYYASSLWGMQRINAPQAWEVTTGSPSIIVADIDTGVDRNHPDLRDAMWVNTKEIPNNSLDDDNNGYIDDYYGWDWINNDNNPMDDHGHGTHTAGTIAARGDNGEGVAGVSWQSKIMALKFLGADGSGSLSDAIQALHYAADNGARIANNSWGCVCNSLFLEDALTYAYNKGVVIVAAAGNNNQDASTFYPAASTKAIAVGALDEDGNRASFSNWGTKIDVMAPGTNILSTRASNGIMCPLSQSVSPYYCYASGTSMAAPHVAGLAALLLSSYPSLTPEEVRTSLRQAATDYAPPGPDSNYGYGLIEAARTVTRQAAPIATPAPSITPPQPAPPPPVTAPNPPPNQEVPVLPPPPAPQSRPEQPQAQVTPPRQLRPLSKKEKRLKTTLEARLRTANRRVNSLRTQKNRYEQRRTSLEANYNTAPDRRKRSLQRQITNMQRTIQNTTKLLANAQNSVYQIQGQLDRLLYY